MGLATAETGNADIVAVGSPIEGGGSIYNAANVNGTPLSIDLSRHGYIEAELFVSGTASTFSRTDNGPTPLEENIEYTTRIVVRRPANWADFSGVVHFEPAHPAQGSTAHWYVAGEYIVESGDAYVLVGLGNDALQRRLTREGPYPTSQTAILKWFDAERYGPISWPDDDGIRWQVMGNIIQWLRSEAVSNPFNDRPLRKLIAAGWSFTGSLLRTYINHGFHDAYRQPSGKPLIDAYFIGISSRWNRSGLLPLSSADDIPDLDDPLRALKPVDAPVMEFLTEFEVALGDGPQKPDSDTGIGAHRLYELGGAVHGDQLLLDRGGNRVNRPVLMQLSANGYPIAGLRGSGPDGDCPLPISDVPLGPFARGALANLKLWIVDGAPPPHASELALDERGNVLRDQHGNPLGGIRIAEFALPLATYDVYRGTELPQCSRTEGRPLILRQDLPSSVLREMYGTRDDYLHKFDDYIDSLVNDRWLLPADAESLKVSVRQRAQAAFREK
jgi:hypothetical protein